MQWALVSTIEMQMMDPHSVPPNRPEMIDVPIGTIINIIVYNGTDPYTPAEGLVLMEVPDEARIGDSGY